MKEIIKIQNAPAPVGPFSQAVIGRGLLFTAGHVGMNPKDGKVVDGGVRAETAQALNNLQALLKAAGSSFDQVLKTTVFLANMDDFTAMNEVYQGFFKGSPPARTTIQAARLPLNALVEIELIALSNRE